MSIGALVGAGSALLSAFGGGGKSKSQPVVTPFQAMPGELRDFASEELFPAIQNQFSTPFVPLPMLRAAGYDASDPFANPELSALQQMSDMQGGLFAPPVAAAPQPVAPAVGPSGMDVINSYATMGGIPGINSMRDLSNDDFELAQLAYANQPKTSQFGGASGDTPSSLIINAIRNKPSAFRHLADRDLRQFASLRPLILEA